MSRGEFQETKRAFVLARGGLSCLLRLKAQVDGPNLLVNWTSLWSFIATWVVVSCQL